MDYEELSARSNGSLAKFWTAALCVTAIGIGILEVLGAPREEAEKTGMRTDPATVAAAAKLAEVGIVSVARQADSTPASAGTELPLPVEVVGPATAPPEEAVAPSDPAHSITAKAISPVPNARNEAPPTHHARHRQSVRYWFPDMKLPNYDACTDPPARCSS